MDVKEAIKTKRAVRLFTEETVSDDVIHQILTSARQSQSSKNTQPWHFIVVRDREMLTALSTLGDYAGHLAGAAFAIILVAESNSTWNSFDIGQAAAYFQLAAWELGVGSCIAALYDEAKAKEFLGIPENKSCYAALSFGYPSPQHVPARLGGRKPSEAVVKWEKW